MLHSLKICQDNLTDRSAQDPMSKTRSVRSCLDHSIDGNAARAIDPGYKGTGLGIRLLMVEDDLLISKCLYRGLSPHLDVTVARCANEALEILNRDPGFDTILSDFNMPDRTGAELRRLIHAELPEFRGHFCFMTGGGFSREITDLLENESEHCIEKPFTIDELRAFLRRHDMDC